MPKVEANGINIFYEYLGDGEPLALIGGSLFGRQNFGMVWDGLAEHFKLISYDQRGYGQDADGVQHVQPPESGMP